MLPLDLIRFPFWRRHTGWGRLRLFRVEHEEGRCGPFLANQHVAECEYPNEGYIRLQRLYRRIDDACPVKSVRSENWKLGIPRPPWDFTGRPLGPRLRPWRFAVQDEAALFRWFPEDVHHPLHELGFGIAEYSVPAVFCRATAHQVVFPARYQRRAFRDFPSCESRDCRGPRNRFTPASRRRAGVGRRD